MNISIIDTSQPICYSNTTGSGSISVTAYNGTAPYTFVWTGDTITSINTTGTLSYHKLFKYIYVIFGYTITDGLLSGLGRGNYSVFAVDANLVRSSVITFELTSVNCTF